VLALCAALALGACSGSKAPANAAGPSLASGSPAGAASDAAGITPLTKAQCDTLNAKTEATSGIDFTWIVNNTDPKVLWQNQDKLVGWLEVTRAAAPPTMQSNLDMILAAVQLVFPMLQTVNGDESKLTPAQHDELTAKTNTPEVENALNSLEAWAVNCYSPAASTSP
jgi:hypothetical protein